MRTQKHPWTQSPACAGFSLLEILLVLSVIAAMALAAFAIYPAVAIARQVNDAQDSANATLAALRSYFAGRNTDGLNRANAMAGGLASDRMMGTAWGLIAPAPAMDSAVGGADCVTSCKRFSLSFNNVPMIGCGSFVEHIALNASRVVIDATDVKNTNTGLATSTVLAACNTAPNHTVKIYLPN